MTPGAQRLQHVRVDTGLVLRRKNVLGVAVAVPVELIEFGDPDGQGDLKRQNQIALRMEVVYGWGVMDLDGFSVVRDAVANV